MAISLYKGNHRTPKGGRYVNSNVYYLLYMSLRDRRIAASVGKDVNRRYRD